MHDSCQKAHYQSEQHLKVAVPRSEICVCKESRRFCGIHTIIKTYSEREVPPWKPPRKEVASGTRLAGTGLGRIVAADGASDLVTSHAGGDVAAPDNRMPVRQTPENSSLSQMLRKSGGGDEIRTHDRG
jgi:hypothetical protein